MTIRVGIIGTGLIGEDHGRKLVNAINGSTVSAVSDVNQARAIEVARVLGGTDVFDDGHDLIKSPEVDAVLVTSIGPTHAEFVLSCIKAGKPVMCEKPLAPTTSECEEILKAKVAFGRRLVIVGYMRRYDPGYRAVKGALESGAIGDAEGFNNSNHAAHRYSWIRPPSTSLRSTGRVAPGTRGVRLPAGTARFSPRCGLSAT